jgi:hypothetical protein
MQLENDAKHFVMQRIRLKTMLNSNSMLPRHFSVKNLFKFRGFLEYRGKR